MIATVEYVERRVAEFNRLMFGGRLPALPIELCDAKGFLGQLACNRQKTEFRMRINTRIDLTQDALDDVIIHEMIHYFIAYHRLIDTGPHGHIFRSIMESINANHGRHIQVSHRHTSEGEWEQSVSKKATWHVIAALELRDGTMGVKVLPRVAPKILAYVDAVRRAPNVKDVSLYMHNNPFFNRYPTSAALKYHGIDRATFLANIAGATPLTRSDFVPGRK